MQANYFATLSDKPAAKAAVAFIAKLVAAGVALANIQTCNFDNKRSNQQGVLKSGPNAGQPNGKYENRHVIVIPVGQEHNASQWKKYNDFRDRHVTEAIELGTTGLPQRGADSPAKMTENVEILAGQL